MRAFLAIDNRLPPQLEQNGIRGVTPEPDSQYRSMVCTGKTYDETGLRKWVATTWDANEAASIELLAHIAAQGGWRILEFVDTVMQEVTVMVGKHPTPISRGENVYTIGAKRTVVVAFEHRNPAGAILETTPWFRCSAHGKQVFAHCGHVAVMFKAFEVGMARVFEPRQMEP